MMKKVFLSLALVEGALLLALLALVGCKRENSPAPVGEQAEPLITMEKTECFGTCPVYTIRIFADGRAEYEGIKNVQKIGRYQQQLSTETIDSLILAFEAAGFWQMEDEYVAEVTDLPTTYVAFHHQGRSKKIKDLIDAPQQLRDLEQRIGDLSESGLWEMTK